MKDDEKLDATYVEFTGKPVPNRTGLPHSRYRKEPEDIFWHTETMSVDSFHEAHEWIMSGPYNEIGYLYSGYITTNWMLAHVLVYERTWRNTISDPQFLVYTNYDYTPEGILYKVWVTPVSTVGVQEVRPEES
ncbi:hypothetical protein [Paenibacillus sp. P46E]|uniref:hypothetical protein n=1 Tax=Paenibacillus sp. P46E TaxID=1349436 RepID=UPI000A973EB9|nr:hypothetical protein [Paenibacillus sp. P46E]